VTALLTYKLGSRSAKGLAEALGVRRVRANGKFRNNYGHIIVNWGSSCSPNFPTPYGIINKPGAVARAVNKLTALEFMHQAGVPVPVFYTDKEQAAASNKILFARTSLTSNSGRGIIIVQQGDDIPEAPLYTEMFDKVTEYRVHATFNKVFDYQAKLRRRGQEADDYIYNYNNGRVFCRNNIDLPPQVSAASIAAIRCLGLHFGAVDVATDKHGNVAVFEVNTSPALEGTTLKRYTNMIRELIT